MRSPKLFLYSFIALLAYAFMAFGLRRWEWYFLFPAFSVTCITYLLSWKHPNQELLFPVGLLFRLVFLFAVPVLSDDYFRFFWDGLNLLGGVNPYHFKPEDWMGLIQLPDWFHLQNSLSYYSIYPPLNQYFFAGISALSGSSIYTFQLLATAVFIAGDVLLYFMLRKLITQNNAKAALANLYWLCPLVIIELVGNLHFELWLLLFLLVCLYLVEQLKFWQAGIFLALSVALKLTSIIALPLLFIYVDWRQSWKLLLSFLITIVAVSIPLLDAFAMQHFVESLSLYFQHFEFHSSLYRLFLWMGLDAAASGLFVLAYLVLLVLAFKRKIGLYQLLFLAFMAQLLTSQMAHPWYFIPVLVMGILAKQKWLGVAVLFSFLSYTTYAFYPYEQQGWIVLVSYAGICLTFNFSVLLKKF